MIKKLHSHARGLLFKRSTNDWQYLVQVILMGLIIGFPFLGSYAPFPLLVFDILFISFILYSILLLESPSFSLLGTGVGALVLLSLGGGIGNDLKLVTDWWLKAESFLLVCYFVLLGVRLIIDVLKESISMKLLYISIINYLNIGILFSFLFRIEHYRNPDLLNFLITEPYNYIYMSFVVLSSVGLGDMLPQNPPAKSLVVLEALIGQLYLTFFVALIVGKYLSQNKSTTGGT